MVLTLKLEGYGKFINPTVFIHESRTIKLLSNFSINMLTFNMHFTEIFLYFNTLNFFKNFALSS